MRNFLRLKALFFSFLIIFVLGCSDSDSMRYNNPYLPNLNVALQLDLNLPEYNNLQFPGNKYVTYNYGIKGIVVYCLNPTTYFAYELTDPNHPPQTCSKLTVTGIHASCECDENEYEIISGQIVEGQAEFTLKPYRVEKIGNVLQITSF